MKRTGSIWTAGAPAGLRLRWKVGARGSTAHASRSDALHNIKRGAMPAKTPAVHIRSAF